jgi:hypothetical protein
VSDAPFTDDGVDYQSVGCVRCDRTVVVASAALLVADRKVWPLCSDCWRLFEVDDDEQRAVGPGGAPGADPARSAPPPDA